MDKSGMRRCARSVLIVVLTTALAGCAARASVPPTARPLATLVEFPQTPEPASYRQSTGGGQPRSTGYWLLWNGCAPGNQAEVAKANGGREAGWILMDDLLSDPGILVGRLQVTRCDEGAAILQARDAEGADHTDDPAYVLAAQLMSAQLNFAAAAESCPAVSDAVTAAQLLLVSLQFDGAGAYLGPPAGGEDRKPALFLSDQLARYNNGELCLP